MKKVLLATSALVATGFVTSAAAAEWETVVGGYYHLGLALAENDNVSDFGVLRDGEFFVLGNLTADNGIRFTARIEVEAHTTGDQIDENWGAVTGSFGRLKIGGDDSAINAYQNGIIYAPGARIGYYDSFALTQAGANQTQNAGNSDAVGVHYDTPNFMGFQAGFSYQPSYTADGPATATRTGDSNNPVFSGGPGIDDFWTVGAAYNGDFGDFGVGISGGYGDGDGANNDVWNIGGNVSFGGFTLAGGYQDADVGGGLGGAFEGETFHIGAQYATGPWTIAGGYSNNSDTDVDVAAGWVTYAVAPGVSTTVGLEYADDGADEDIGGLAYLRLSF